MPEQENNGTTTKNYKNMYYCINPAVLVRGYDYKEKRKRVMNLQVRVLTRNKKCYAGSE